MIALHAGPEPAPRRQLFVGTAVVGAGIITLFGGMLATWMRMRDDAMDATGVWLPKKVVMPEVASNVVLIAFLGVVIFAQWAVYAARRDDRPNAGLALGLTALLGLAIINAMVYVFNQIRLPIHGGAYNTMFYAVTGTFTVLAVIGVGFSVVCLFRYLGGRSVEREIVSAHALYWYVLAAVFAAVWFVVFVTK
jgi:cytochrome c oxidase subunit 3